MANNTGFTGDLTNILQGQVSNSTLFTFLVGWHANAVSFTPLDVIFAQLDCPLNDIIFVQLVLNEADTLKFSLILIYLHAVQSIYTQGDRHDAVLIKMVIKLGSN